MLLEVQKILKQDNLDYKDIDKYLVNSEDDDLLNELLNNINKFNLESKKTILNQIIIKSNKKNIVEMSCMYILSYIEYEYSYYKNILKNIANKKMNGTWISEIKRRLLEDNPRTMQEVFEDFSLEKPLDINYDLMIINKFLEEYDEKKYLEDVVINIEQAISLCRKLNYILTINTKNILRFYCYIIDIHNLSENQFKQFIDTFFFNFPYMCKEIIMNNDKLDDNCLIKKYLDNKIKEFDLENEIKFNMNIFKPNIQRVKEYRRYQANQSKEINKQANEMSILRKIGQTNTILYSNRYGIIVRDKNGEHLSESSMNTISYEYPYPLEYLLDPLEYMSNVYDVIKTGEEE